jgi:hypothetical protein
VLLDVELEREVDDDDECEDEEDEDDDVDDKDDDEEDDEDDDEDDDEEEDDELVDEDDICAGVCLIFFCGKIVSLFGDPRAKNSKSFFWGVRTLWFYTAFVELSCHWQRYSACHTHSVSSSFNQPLRFIKFLPSLNIAYIHPPMSLTVVYWLYTGIGIGT